MDKSNNPFIEYRNIELPKHAINIKAEVLYDKVSKKLETYIMYDDHTNKHIHCVYAIKGSWQLDDIAKPIDADGIIILKSKTNK